MKKHIFPLTALTLVALTACTSSTLDGTSADSASASADFQGAYTWEAGSYPADAPSLLIQEDPDSQSGWYMGSDPSLANLQSQPGNFNTWQTIYSYKDSSDPRGATVAVVFYTDLERCSLEGGPQKTMNVRKQFTDWIMQDRLGLNTSAYYEYVFNGEGRTYPHPNDDQTSPVGAVDRTNSLINLPKNMEDTQSPNPRVEGAEIKKVDASSYIGVPAADALGKPGRTAEFFANYTKDSNGELVPTGCATVYTALSNEAAATYDSAKFAQAHEQAVQFAQQIETMPRKAPLGS